MTDRGVAHRVASGAGVRYTSTSTNPAGSTASDSTLDPEAASAAAGIGSGAAILWLLWGGMWTLIWAAFAINHTLKERHRR